ncbi:hypothetical protein ACTEWE_005164 [Salmonella enterica]
MSLHELIFRYSGKNAWVFFLICVMLSSFVFVCGGTFGYAGVNGVRELPSGHSVSQYASAGLRFIGASLARKAVRLPNPGLRRADLSLD